MYVFFISWTRLAYVWSSRNSRSGPLFSSAPIGQSGIRWKCKWFTDFPLTQPTSPSLKRRLTALCFICNFLDRVSTKRCSASNSLWLNSWSNVTCLLGIIKRWSGTYGALAGMIYIKLSWWILCSSFSLQKGQWCLAFIVWRASW